MQGLTAKITQPIYRAFTRLAMTGKTGVALLLAVTTAQAAGPTGSLNDSGQTRCLNNAGTALEACTSANSGDASTRPRQDGRFGRDPAAGNTGISGFNKPAGSGGSGGFAFTPLDVNGDPIPMTGNPPVPSATPRCIWDRVTNLIWEVKTNDDGLQDKDWTYGWGDYDSGSCYVSQSPAGCGSDNYIIALNATSICPVSGSGVWRLPKRRELLSIIDHDRSNPAVDTGFIPNTMSNWYWSADEYAPYPDSIWLVDFIDGRTINYTKDVSTSVRLVRNGP